MPKYILSLKIDRATLNAMVKMDYRFLRNDTPFTFNIEHFVIMTIIIEF